MRLFWRIYLCLLASAVLAFSAAAWHANRSLRRLYHEQLHAELQQQADWAASEIRRFSLRPEGHSVDRRCKELGGLTPYRMTVVLPDGRVIGDSESDPADMENHANRPEIAEALAGGIGRAERFSGTVRRRMAYRSVPVRRNGEIVAVVRTAIPMANVDRTLRTAYREVALGVLGAAILFALPTTVVVRRFVRPLEEMRAVAERLADGDLQARIDAPPGGSEMRALSRALNQMAEQLAARMTTITGQRNELKAVLASMSESVLAVDSEGRILHFNAAAGKLLGLEESRGRVLEESIRQAELQRFVRDLLASGRAAESEIMIEGERHLRLHGAPLDDAAGRRIGALVVMSDTTRLKRLEKVRQDFVANVSHELKTPITALRGGIDTLLDSERNEEDRRFIQMMSRQVDRLSAIVGDLLSLSRLEHDEQNGLVPLDSGRVGDVLRRAVANCAKAAEAGRIALVVDCPEVLQARMNAPLLEQAVGNLIDNAIKYSGERTRVEVSATGGNGEGVIIRVRDEGPGIESRHLPRIFERFYRVDHARSRALGGTGLGLAIVKHIARAHGGGVSVESLPGRGSIFTIRLPSALENPGTSR